MFLYGMSLIYGVTGTTYYDGIAEGLADRGAGTNPAVIVGMMLILAGVGFKVSAAPFHMWAPDAYQGAPLPITAFLSTASKAAGFALILRLFTGALIVDAAEWRWAVAALAAVTMTLGNLVAIQQSNLKRLVAYSSIGQVGYMLITIAAIGYGDAKVGQDASAALLLHIAGYVIATLALFAALTAAYNRTGREDIPGARAGGTQPSPALVITIALVPPSPGCRRSRASRPSSSCFEARPPTSCSGWSAVLNSFISLYYYLMVIRRMYLFSTSRRWPGGR